ncbi:MAG: UbiA family prenyltransferase, partial [Ignavibacteria bacterium]|nr:UbiA family prenyltransferase [Ignavibacteria bacterium]
MSKLALNINSRSISIGETVRIFSELIKFRITSLVTLTTAMGYILASGDFISLEGLIYVSSGIFLLAAAASCLNHWQESKTDALMERTRYRPIPSGRIEPNSVLSLFVILFISGSLVLLSKSGFYSFLAGVFTFIWYNFIYTPLKRKTAFAIIPGALVGALPPL